MWPMLRLELPLQWSWVAIKGELPQVWNAALQDVSTNTADALDAA